MNKWLMLIKEKIKRAFSKFFVTIIASVFTTICSLVLARMAYDTQAYELVQRLLATGALYTVLSFFMARCDFRRVQHQGVKQIMALGLAIVFVFPAQFNAFYWLQYAVLMWIAFLLAFLLPYRAIGEGFAHLTVRVIGNFLETFLFSAALMIGLSGLIASMDLLFDISFYSDIYFDLFKLILGVFSVVYFLGLVPEKTEPFSVKAQGANFFKLIVFVLMPILCAYAVLLHAYFVKILFMRHLPEGMVGNLVLWFVFVTFLVLYFSKDYFEKSLWSKRFHEAFPFLLVIPMALFFVAMWVRVSAYGMTHQRYFAYALAIYLVGAIVMIRFSKKDMMRYVVGLSIPILVLSVFGPLSANAMTLRSQLHRLERVLSQNEMLDDQGKVRPKNPISATEKEKIENAVTFLLNHYEVSQISFLPEGFDTSESKDVFGFDFYQYIDDATRTYFSVEALTQRQEAMGLNEADYLMRIETYSGVQLETQEGFSVKYVPEEVALKFLENSKEIGSVSMDEVARLVVANPDENPEKVILLDNGLELALSFYFLDLSGERFGETGESLNISYFRTFVLFKVLPKVN